MPKSPFRFLDDLKVTGLVSQHAQACFDSDPNLQSVSDGQFVGNDEGRHADGPSDPIVRDCHKVVTKQKRQPIDCR
jgi:hypothetical protein